MRLDDTKAVVEDLERSVAIYSAPDNGAVDNLLHIYAQLGRKRDFRALRRRAYGSDDMPEPIRALTQSLRGRRRQVPREAE